MAKSALPYDDIVKSAARHGNDSDPDHEIGDLQDALKEAVRLMTPVQRARLYTWWQTWGYLNG